MTTGQEEAFAIDHVENMLPKHQAGFYLQHNMHKDYYQPPADWVKEQGDNVIWASDEAKQRAIARDSIWSLQWYPNTPIGSYHVAAPTFQEVLELARKIEKEGD
jgi:hypothetical protein